MLRMVLAAAVLMGAAATAATVHAEESPTPTLHAGGVWWMYVDEEMCLAQAQLHDGRMLQLIHADRYYVGVGVPDGQELARGSRGEIATDEGRFPFTPDYPAPNYLMADGGLTEAQVGLLRSTRSLQVHVDGEVIADAGFEDGDGYPQIIDDVAACAAGRPGWWSAEPGS